MLEKALPVLKAVLNMHDEFRQMKGDAEQLSAKVASLTERVATLEGKLDSLPQVVKAIVDDRLMGFSRRRKRSLPG